MSESNTRCCTECREPMTLGKRACQACGSTSWQWIDPTMTDAAMRDKVIDAARQAGHEAT